MAIARYVTGYVTKAESSNILDLWQEVSVCLYEFVSEYTKSSVDAHGNIVYRKLTKHVLPNHKIYNPNKEGE